VLGFAVPFWQHQHPAQKCWVKIILLSHRGILVVFSVVDMCKNLPLGVGQQLETVANTP